MAPKSIITINHNANNSVFFFDENNGGVNINNKYYYNTIKCYKYMTLTMILIEIVWRV